jgi:hypothetical protein
VLADLEPYYVLVRICQVGAYDLVHSHNKKSTFGYPIGKVISCHAIASAVPTLTNASRGDVCADTSEHGPTCGS